MKRSVYFTRSLLALLLLLLPSVLADEPQPPHPFRGLWKWTFTMPDGSQVNPRLELKYDEAGQLTGKTRLRPGTEMPVTNVIVQGNQLSFEVARERDGREVVTRYSGSLDGDTIKGKITSNWSGEEQTYDWDARRLVGATGTWRWTTVFGEYAVENKLTLKQEGEKLTGKLNSVRSENEIKKGKFKDGRVSFEVEREREGEKSTNRFHGKISGDTIKGKMELNFFGRLRTNDWEAVRTD